MNASRIIKKLMRVQCHLDKKVYNKLEHGGCS